MNTLDTEQLQARLADGQRVWLVHASETSFRVAHLPGALYFANADQAAVFLRSDDSIVVYGYERTCRTSRELAAELTRRGFVDVWLYADGLRSWIAAGGQVEGTRDPDHA